jgi:hypothetical protein
MNDDTISKPNASATTCRIAPPADDRFDEEAFLLREMAEAKAALRRTVGAVKDHAGRELKPRRMLRRHPLAAAGALGLGGFWLVRKIIRIKSGRVRREPSAPAEPVQKVGLFAMLLPSLVAVVQGLTAAKMTNAQAAATPQAWMAKTLWGLARDRFRGRGAAPAASDPADPAAPEPPANGSKIAGSRKPIAEPTHRRRMRPK